MEKVPNVADVMLVAFVVGILVSGITEVLKTPFKGKWKGQKKPTWWRVSIRAVPVFLGTLVGWPFFDDPWGLVVGGSSGVLCTVLYKRAKKFIVEYKS